MIVPKRANATPIINSFVKLFKSGYKITTTLTTPSPPLYIFYLEIFLLNTILINIGVNMAFIEKSM